MFSFRVQNCRLTEQAHHFQSFLKSKQMICQQPWKFHFWKTLKSEQQCNSTSKQFYFQEPNIILQNTWKHLSKNTTIC